MELAASIPELFERQKINKFEKQRVVYKNNRFVALPSCSRGLPLHGAPMKPHNVIQKAPKKKRSQSLSENACYGTYTYCSINISPPTMQLVVPQRSWR